MKNKLAISVLTTFLVFSVLVYLPDFYPLLFESLIYFAVFISVFIVHLVLSLILLYKLTSRLIKKQITFGNITVLEYAAAVVVLLSAFNFVTGLMANIS